MTYHNWIILIFVAILHSGQLAAPAEENVLLSRPVVLDEKGTSASAAASLLGQAHVPGGIISLYGGCAQPTEQQFSLQRATLQEGLNYVATVDTSRTWAYRGGTVIVGHAQVNSTLLNTTVGDLDIYMNETLSHSTQRLLESAEIRSGIRKAGLGEMNPVLGFFSVDRGGTAPSGQPLAVQPTHLHQVSLEDALNLLALAKGEAVWHYEQFLCGSKSSFRISWAVSKD